MLGSRIFRDIMRDVMYQKGTVKYLWNFPLKTYGYKMIHQKSDSLSFRAQIFEEKIWTKSLWIFEFNSGWLSLVQTKIQITYSQ